MERVWFVRVAKFGWIKQWVISETQQWAKKCKNECQKEAKKIYIDRIVLKSTGTATQSAKAISQAILKASFKLQSHAGYQGNYDMTQMLKEAVEKDKDFTGVLRKMGCKTRMRVRNKTAAKELFEVMLDYIQLG